ncbi:MAG: hypothetical protein QOI87_2931 [Bradyrhizobium sp.]|nr:hypothetical protein [Bradyrhizobium sp.]
MAGKLKPLEVARMVAPGKYPDGDGLYLIIASPTSRNWSYRYWIGGKERWHGLGSLRDVSLKDARIKRDTARQKVRAGSTSCRRSDQPERMPKPTRPRPPRRRSRNVLKNISRTTAPAGAKSTPTNGRRR